MNLLAVVGSPRKGMATDTLVDKVIEGVRSVCPAVNVKKIHLADMNIGHCRGCLLCRDNVAAEPFAPCAIRDDMDALMPEIAGSDLLIVGTPLRMGHVSSHLMKFLERICWTFARPTRRILTIHGCPAPRSRKERASVTVITNSIIPPLYRFFCDDASSLIKVTLRDSLNARTAGDLYAGDIEHRGVDPYIDRAFALGKKLVSQ